MILLLSDFFSPFDLVINVTMVDGLWFVFPAIVALKEEVMQYKKTNVKPVLEEFIPLKKSCYEVEDRVEMDKESEDKKNWMSSVQLWNYSDNHNSEFNSKQKQLVEINKVLYQMFMQT